MELGQGSYMARHNLELEDTLGVWSHKDCHQDQGGVQDLSGAEVCGLGSGQELYRDSIC